MATGKIDIPTGYVTGILGASGGYDEGHLIAADDTRRFIGIATFLKAPLLKDVAQPTVGMVGIPFDGGSSRTAGSRFGPRGVREASFRVSGYNPELDVRPYDIHNLADCGDILVSPFSIIDTYKSIERGVASLLDRGIVPISIGGDHSVTLPLLRAMHARHGKLALVHFGPRRSDTCRLAVSLRQRVPPRRRGRPDRRGKTVQIGIRSTITRRINSCAPTAEAPPRDRAGADVPRLAERLARLKGHKVRDPDIDFVDAACAPA
jgi:arginase family enzyme